MSRWYNSKGEYVETVQGKNGKDRAPTVRDARVNGYFPSVTTVLGQIDKPALTTYFINEAIKAAYNNQWALTKPIKEATNVLAKISKEEGNKAAQFGTKIHKHIELLLKAKAGENINIEKDVAEYVEPVFKYLLENNVNGESEKRVIIDCEGKKAGGTIDLVTKNTLVDFKTQKTKDKKFKKYDSWLWQLGGYNLSAKKDKACIIAISSTEPNTMKVFSFDKEEIEKGEIIFKLLLTLFYAIKGL